jgi:predicted SnoaL-like aldol condensation-catalyzing enzyme
MAGLRAMAVAALVLGATSGAASAADPEANKQLYRHYMEDMWNKHDPSAADRYVSPDFIEHNPRLPSGLAGRKQFVASVLATFSDYHGEVQEVRAEGDMVVARVLWTGTQDGPSNGQPPTGNKLVFTTADFLRIENGKFVEHWDVVDTAARAAAFGLVLAPKSP